MKNNKANNLEPLTDNEIININGGSKHPNHGLIQYLDLQNG